METLWNLYQERLNELNSSFILLLSQFEDNQLLTTPELSKYRIEYLGSMVEKTLKNNQEKLILKLYKEIDDLRNTNEKLQEQIRQLNKSEDSSCCVNNPNEIQSFEYKQKSLSSTKVSTVSNNRRERLEADGDSFMDSCSSKFGKRKQNSVKSKSSISSGLITENNKIKQRASRITHKRQNNQNQPEQSEQDHQQMEMLLNMNFKYLKF